MFGRKTITPVVLEAPDPTHKPAPQIPTSGKVGFGEDAAVIPEWLNLCKIIGLSHGKPGEVELLRFCQQEGIQVYNTQRVFDYLTAKARESKAVWNHYPLRDIDAATTGDLWAAVSEWPKGHGNTDRCFRSKIPIPVLITIQKLIDKFGNDIYFYVAAINDDPFLGVVLKDSNLIYIERWDEPSFRG